MDVNMPYRIVPLVYFLVYEYLVVTVYAVLELEEAEEEEQQQRPQKIHLNWRLIQAVTMAVCQWQRISLR
jgi:hypothetical protein